MNVRATLVKMVEPVKITLETTCVNVLVSGLVKTVRSTIPSLLEESIVLESPKYPVWTWKLNRPSVLLMVVKRRLVTENVIKNAIHMPAGLMEMTAHLVLTHGATAQPQQDVLKYLPTTIVILFATILAACLMAMIVDGCLNPAVLSMMPSVKNDMPMEFVMNGATLLSATGMEWIVRRIHPN